MIFKLKTGYLYQNHEIIQFENVWHMVHEKNIKREWKTEFN